MTCPNCGNKKTYIETFPIIETTHHFFKKDNVKKYKVKICWGCGYEKEVILYDRNGKVQPNNRLV